MKTCRSPMRLFVGWLQRCGVVFIGGGLLLAFGAATFHAATKLSSSASGIALLWNALAYLILAALGLAGLRWVQRNWGTRGFLLTVLGGSMLIQLGVLFSVDSQWNWTGDSQIFEHYLAQLSDNGYAQETLEELSQNYDYRVWTRRAQPFYYLLRVGAGTHFVLAVQLFQAFLLTLSLLLTHRLAKLLFGQRVAFWAVTLQFLMPFRWIACIDLNHHLLGGFYFLTGLWILAEWIRPGRRPLISWLLFLCAGILLPLMRLEGGIDTVYIGALALVLLLYWMTRSQTTRQTAISATVLLVWPILVSAILLSPFFQRIEQADLHHHESGPLAFMARGWVPETGGEYSYTPEQIDYLTPHKNKLPMQASLLASQAFYNPRVLLTKLLPVKMAKYGLLGYAAGAEEMLERNGARRAKQFAEGARTAYLLTVLPLMIWGAVLLLPLLRRTRQLCIILPCTLIYTTFVLLGETSPRYSIYIQPFLFMLAGLPLAWRVSRRNFLLRRARIPGLVAAGSLLALFLLVTFLTFASRPWLRQHAVQDMRLWHVSPHAQARVLPDTLTPFEIQLLPESLETGTTWGGVYLPPHIGSTGTLSFYALPDGATSGQLRNALLIMEYNTLDGLRRQTNSLPGRIRLEYSLSTDGVLSFLSPGALPFPLRIGYATYEPHEKTTN